MLDINKDINSLSDFKRNTAEHLRQLKSSGHPLVLTVNGKAELVVQDTASYQKLLDLAERAERLETIQAVKDGLASMKRGEGRPMDEVFDQLQNEMAAKAGK